MTTLISQVNPSKINVKTANRAILTFGLLPLVSASFWNLPHNLGFLSFAVINSLAIALLFYKPLQEFIKDRRFRTIPRLTSIFVLSGVVIAINLGIVLFLSELIGYFVPDLNTILEKQEDSLGLSELANSSILDISVILLAGAVIVPVYEEFLFRGLALKAYEKAKSPLFSAIFTSILFASLHFSLLRLIAFIPSFFIVAKAVQKKGSWWLAVIAHTINNAIAFSLDVFTHQVSKTDKLPPDLSTGVFGLVIAILAFTLAAYWLRLFTPGIPTQPEQPEKILTPALTIVVSLTVIVLGFQLYSLIFIK
jgi:membrane protease YdiL (CAAX protease family)